ncbi:GNAT family N-acetyltransferase [Nocardiopsis sp. CNT312]|uniref:GNAT family N-acetyltransferase n=1 Tax=Nocardiopsis sp. CNT312 TaxID=1137268 RepID=UPI0012DD6D55|nr:GNAT family N-acetyltransferase [Nocardiopsis sp. CNT312]
MILTMKSEDEPEHAAHQSGAIRWNETQNIATEIYVTPTMRRKGIGTALWRMARNLHAIETGRALQPSRRRTILGELLTQKICTDPPKVKEIILPMTPQSEINGARKHQLVPDDMNAILRLYSDRGSSKQIRALCAATAEEAWGYLRKKNRS